MRVLKTILLLFPLTFLLSVPALANTCSAFSPYTCGKKGVDAVKFQGTGTTGQSVGILLGSNTFSVNVNGGKFAAGDELILLAVSPNGLPTGTVNGVGFTSLGALSSTFPEGGAEGAITSTWTGLGISFSSPEVGYAVLGPYNGAPISVTASGVGTGTIFYGEVLNPTTGQIIATTANSEAGVLSPGTTVVPEPGSLSLLGTGLVGLAGLVRRKITKG